MVKTLRSDGLDSLYNIGDKVKTTTLSGVVIGLAEFVSGWEYRIKVVGKTKTYYRKESQLKADNG